MNLFKIFIAVAAVSCFAFLPKNEPKKISIVLDAGHGGTDHGATHDDVTEKQITAVIIEKIRSLNKNQDIDIRFTRISDDLTTLEQRTEIINTIKPDLVLSFHVNANKNTAASGVDIFTPKSENVHSEKATELGQKLSAKLEKDLGMRVRGVKQAPFFILNKSTVPALVVELGYLTNTSDRAYLTDEKSQDRIAAAILEFISEIK